MAQRPIILAAGGSGGHMFPAQALAQVLLDRGERVILVTDKRGGAFGDTMPNVKVKRISGAAPVGGLSGMVSAAFSLFNGWLEARSLMMDFAPTAVVGFGGYASMPTVFAAQRMRIPTVLHEQNAVLGRANRWLLRRAKIMATSFDDVQGVWSSISRLTVMTGTPVRPEIAALAGSTYRPSGEGEPFYLLVTGGSQGARIFSALIPAAVRLLPPELQARLHIEQQARPEVLAATKAAYEGFAGHVEVQPFFKDMPERLARCHLAICRSGASTITELATVGRPAFFVPLPFAMDNHQMVNAESVVATGGGWAFAQIELTPALLAARLTKAMTKPDLLARVAAAAHTRVKLNAAEHLADAVQAAASLSLSQPQENEEEKKES